MLKTGVSHSVAAPIDIWEVLKPVSIIWSAHIASRTLQCISPGTPSCKMRSKKAIHHWLTFDKPVCLSLQGQVEAALCVWEGNYFSQGQIFWWNAVLYFTFTLSGIVFISWSLHIWRLVAPRQCPTGTRTRPATQYFFRYPTRISFGNRWVAGNPKYRVLPDISG